MKKTFQSKKGFTTGFTLIETLVAVTVLLISIVGPLSIAANSLFASFYARDEITAYYLAAEAVEYVKNARDTTFLNDVFGSSGEEVDESNWLNGLTSCIANPVNNVSGCRVNATEPFMIDNVLNGEAIVICSESGCDPIGTNSSGLWGYGAGFTPSKFTRTIELIPQSNNDIAGQELRIEVKVSWQGNSVFGGEKSVELTAFMTNWQRK